MMKSLCLVSMFLLVLQSCDAAVDTVEQTNKPDTLYPIEIRHLKLEKKYNEARWYIYCMMSDSKVPFDTNFVKLNDTSTTYGMLPLLFDQIIFRQDSIDVNFFFYYKNRRVDGLLVDPLPVWGAVFKKNSDSIIQFTSRDEAAYFMFWCNPPIADCPYRTVNPLQPEVIKYIKENKDKLDPWFRREAVKRGVIVE